MNKKKVLICDLNNIWCKSLYVCNYILEDHLKYMLRYIQFVYKSHYYDEIYLVIDGKDNSAKSKFEKYKEGRAKREGSYDSLRTFVSIVCQYVKVVRNKKAEGDFVVAKMALYFKERGADVTIFSNDKDFLQLAQFDIKVAEKIKQGIAIPLTTEEILMKFKNSKKEPLDKLENILKYRVFKGDSSDKIPSAVKGLQDKYIREVINLWEGNKLDEDILYTIIGKIDNRKVKEQVILNKNNILRNYFLMNLIEGREEVLEEAQYLKPKKVENDLKKWKVDSTEFILPW